MWSIRPLFASARRVRHFPQGVQIFPRARRSVRVNAKKQPRFSTSGKLTCGDLLALDRTEHQVFRALSLSIVLTLAVAPTAALLCEAGCQPTLAAATGCDDEEVSGTAAAVQPDSCQDCGAQAARLVLLLTDDLRHSLSTPPAGLVISTRGDLLTPSTFDLRFGGNPGRQQSLTNHPVPSVLRI
jgi:hypothetical protein